jgi:hypothetical protein
LPAAAGENDRSYRSCRHPGRTQTQRPHQSSRLCLNPAA